MEPTTSPATPAEVLAYVKEMLRVPGGYTYSQHAIHERMQERNVRVGDLKHAIRTATQAEQQPNGTWRLKGGTDTDGVELVPVVDVRKRPMVIVNVL